MVLHTLESDAPVTVPVKDVLYYEGFGTRLKLRGGKSLVVVESPSDVEKLIEREARLIF